MKSSSIDRRSATLWATRLDHTQVAYVVTFVGIDEDKLERTLEPGYLPQRVAQPKRHQGVDGGSLEVLLR